MVLKSNRGKVALTGKVRSSTQVTDFPTNQELALADWEDN